MCCTRPLMFQSLRYLKERIRTYMNLKNCNATTFTHNVRHRLLGGIPHGFLFTARSQALPRSRSPSHARLVKISGRLPVRHQAEIWLVGSLDPTANHDSVVAECRLPMVHPEGVRISKMSPHIPEFVAVISKICEAEDKGCGSSVNVFLTNSTDGCSSRCTHIVSRSVSFNISDSLAVFLYSKTGIHIKEGEQWTRVSPLLELLSSTYSLVFRGLNSAYVTCDASLSPLLHQHKQKASELLLLNR
ncbi:hypothetical protein T265_03660 [Opisthorchis viverrini]|uniref:Uncharacterized protein n=1 Tax=Opisthorchis viverrini TaxID=6198 RepID=A0A074ZQR4_OPIVI|nr:hypothetical protein T265_03660 [Opisthorchis viverrini]KER29748.1 hypothetical protein T265_03660 [Opisthorchis viverrini]